MARLQIRWNMQVEGFSERGEDEVAIQFAMVTVFGDQARVDMYRISNLFPSGGFAYLPDEVDDEGRRYRARGTVTRRNVPTTRNPYLGFVARAIEEDSSQNRGDDDRRFREAIRTTSQQIVTAGGLPSTSDLWPAGQQAEIEHKWFIDDDDKVSTSVRVFPEFGNRLNEALAAEPTTPEGGVILPGPDESFVITFVGSGQSAGARYQTRIWISLVTNGGPASTQEWW